MVKRSKSASSSRSEEPGSHRGGTSSRCGLLQAVAQRSVAKFGKRLAAFGVVEWAVAVMRHGADPRRCLDGDLLTGKFGGQPSDLQERMDLAGGDVQRADAAVLQRLENEFGRVIPIRKVPPVPGFSQPQDF